MLILAGVIIATTMDSDGIIADAGNATQQWNDKITAQDEAIQNALIKRNEILGGTTTTVQLPAGWEASKVADVVEEQSTNRKAPVPVGYTASQISTEDEISEGLVIYQTTTAVTGEPNSEAHITAMEGINQYVWIPVDDINDMIMCKNNYISAGSYEENGETITTIICKLEYDVSTNQIICKTHNYTTATALTDATIDTTGLAGRLYGTDTNTYNTPYKTNMEFTEDSKSDHIFYADSTSSDSEYREPDLVIDFDEDNYQLVLNESSTQAITSVNELKHQLNNKFIEMAKSVARYGGFYVSRYEAGANGASLKNQKVLVAGTKTTFMTGYNVDTWINGNKWYGIYNTLMSSTAADKTAVNTHMIWGCQYDMIIKYLSENNINEPQIGHTTRQLGEQKLTGQTSTDIMSNIYDLEGNNTEWTTTAYWTDSRISRGNCFRSAANSRFYPSSDRMDYDDATGTYCCYTSRSVLYVK